jgi:hypothetical protein
MQLGRFCKRLQPGRSLMIPHPFALDSDAIDPQFLRFQTLASDAPIPAICLATFDSDLVVGAEIARVVQVAARLRCRHFGGATVHANEYLIGAVRAHKSAADGQSGKVPIVFDSD